jgi:UDP-N-acetyl-alpha-D-muramoyl-L-alanyl-L-glutamate epimerase
VTLEVLKRAGEPLILFALGDFDAIDAVAVAAGLPCIKVSRRLSPALLELNRRGAWNGHVPISAIIAFLLPVCALLYGFDAAALSNERSASVGNLTADEQVVNHQYSKGLEFERRVSRHLREHVLGGFSYFSFLRPLSELAIARAFAGFISDYECFTSCNSNFRISGRPADGRRWCLDCAKCRSTFLLLAPFVPKGVLVRLFGANLLDLDRQRPGYGALLGLEGHKPFDCVGEAYEYAAAMGLLAQNGQWAGDRIVAQLGPRLDSFGDRADLVRRALAFSDDHLLPPRYRDILHAYCGA